MWSVNLDIISVAFYILYEGVVLPAIVVWMKAEEPVERFWPVSVKGQFDLHRLICKHDLRQ